MDQVVAADLETHGAVPESRVGATATAVGVHKVYVFGGSHSSSGYSVLVLDTDTSRWERVRIKGTPPAKRSGHTCLAHEGHLVVFGGRMRAFREELFLNDVHAFDLTDERWVKPRISGRLPAARFAHAAVVVGHRMFVFGGSDATSLFSDLHVLDLTTFMWELVHPVLDKDLATSEQIPESRRWHSMVAIQMSDANGVPHRDYLLVYGGQNSQGNALSDMWLFDIHRRRWSRVAQTTTSAEAAPVARYAHTMAFVPQLHEGVLFGGCSGSDSLGDLWSLSIPLHADREFEWTRIECIPRNYELEPRQEHSAVLLGQNLFFMFGSKYNGEVMTKVSRLRLDSSHDRHLMASGSKSTVQSPQRTANPKASGEGSAGSPSVGDKEAVPEGAVAEIWFAINSIKSHISENIAKVNEKLRTMDARLQLIEGRCSGLEETTQELKMWLQHPLSKPRGSYSTGEYDYVSPERKSSARNTPTSRPKHHAVARFELEDEADSPSYGRRVSSSSTDFRDMHAHLDAPEEEQQHVASSDDPYNDGLNDEQRGRGRALLGLEIINAESHISDLYEAVLREFPSICLEPLDQAVIYLVSTFGDKGATSSEVMETLHDFVSRLRFFADVSDSPDLALEAFPFCKDIATLPRVSSQSERVLEFLSKNSSKHGDKLFVRAAPTYPQGGASGELQRSSSSGVRYVLRPSLLKVIL